MLGLGAIDLVLYGIIILSLLAGLMRGLTHQVISLLFLIIAYFASKHFAGAFTGSSENEMIGSAYYLLSFAGIFIVVVLLGMVINFIISRLVNATPLVFVNKLLGTFFGFFKGCLIGMVLVYVAQYTPIEGGAAWQASTLIPRYQSFNNALSEFLGDNINTQQSPTNAAPVTQY